MFDSVPTGGYIYAAIYSLTEPMVVKTLARAAHKGVQVYIITDREQSQNPKQTSAINTLRMAGAAIKMNTHSGLMHMKVALINDWYLATGSMNWSWAGVDGKNEENFIVIPISVDPQLYKAHKIRFEQMWNDSTNYQ
jgi:phosphatidylserine/phosphatidylglycerophosphate/cardiolipin synthase-like enzyme